LFRPIPAIVAKGNTGEKTSPVNNQNKNSRHGSEMGVFSEQLEIPGFKQ
jgi:hypothetical protein